MPANYHLLFVADPTQAAQFYTDKLRLPAPKERELNGRLVLDLPYTNGILSLRQSRKPQPVVIPDRLEYRLPADLPLDSIAASVGDQATEISRGTTPKGVQYLDLMDSIGIRWRIFAHSAKT